MNPEHWKQVDSLLQAALACPPAERQEFLLRACAGDEALEREIRSLLAAHGEAEHFLEIPAVEIAARAMAVDHSASREICSLLAGQTISHYRIVEKLGDGGMGVVWKARDTRLNRFVALKVLPAARMGDPERKRRFVQEARAASALNHPNIITIYDIGQAGPEGKPFDFIAMEFVSGKTLDQLKPRKALALNEALHYSIQVADALAAAHAAGIVHRDLKPGNIMVNGGGSVKVLDFGLAKIGQIESATLETTAHAQKTEEGTILGTASFMSPEQAQGKSVDARTDIFSFGAVLYELITGRRAFTGDCVASVLSAILRDRPAPVAEIVRDLPRELDRIVARCLEKDPARRYQHAGDLKIDLQQVREGLAAGAAAPAENKPGRLRGGRWWWPAAVAACLAISAAIGWRLLIAEAAPPPWKLKRLTSEAGLSGFPAFSPDGRLLAYSSDYGADGRDLYVKQVAGGHPIRLTFDGAGNTTPDFSPDGAAIVFRSERDGGGIYEIPAFGGEVRLIARNGLNPKFSPDGSQVAYWIGEWYVAASVPGSGAVWVVPVSGGPPQRVGAHLTAARYPIWSPDGKHLLVIGYTSARAHEASSLDWWLIATNGSDSVRTGVFDKLVHARDPARVPQNLFGPRPGCWTAAGDKVVYSLLSGETANLWQVGISPRTGKVSGIPERLTTAAGSAIDPSCAAEGTLTFANVETRADVWLTPFDLNRGTPRGALARVTTGPAWRDRASLANNGRYVAFASGQSDPVNIWVHDLATGKEVEVATSSFYQRYPLADASGARVAFSQYEKDKRAIYVSAPGGSPEKLCEGCLQATDWSKDEKTVLVFGGDPFQVNLLDLSSHRQTPLLKHPTYKLLYARFSPDNRWVSFTVRTQPSRGHIAIAPIDGPAPVPESAWITIAETGAGDWANWSPDGRTLYFTSARDGHGCLWGQRIDPSSHRPLGQPFAVQHFHGRVSYRQGGWSAAGGKIAMVLVEETGNIWMMSRSGER